MKKIFVIVGTRPNFVKVTRFKEVARQYPDLRVELVHTGQHADERMSGIFFDQFGSHPDHRLSIPDGTPAARIAHIMLELEPLLISAPPAAVVVVGDVDSTLAAAITADRIGVPVIHLESGLRSGDRSMPEEMNRIIVDRIARHHLVTEPSGKEHLLREGVGEDGIHFVGNTMIDTLVAFNDRIEASNVLERLDLKAGEHLLVTMHRPATVDDPERAEELVELLEQLARELPVVYPIHPRTMDRLQKADLLLRLKSTKGLRLTEPMDYFSFQKLLSTSLCVLTDSGGVQEETTYRRIPCITLRANTERPITISQGTNRLIPTFAPSVIMEAIALVKAGKWEKGRIPDLWDGHATERVFAVLNEVL